MNHSKVLITCSLLLLANTSALWAQKTFHFTVHHLLNAKSAGQVVLIEPWVKKIEQESKGRLKFEIFPSMSLGGKPADLYQQLRDGTADLVWMLPAYTPGVFPRLEVFELPGVHQGSAKATTLAIQDMMDAIKEDIEDVKPILIHVHGGNALHLSKKKITRLQDLKGLKIRIPSRTGSWLIDSWGAEPVGMPVPALPQALSKGTVDGTMLPFEVAIPLKLTELIDNSVELSDNRRFGTLVFIFAMNKKRYNSLPADLKKIIDDNSGLAIAGSIGETWDELESTGIETTLKKGKSVYSLSKEASKEFDKLNEKVVDRWIREVKKNDIDGKNLVETARTMIKKYTEKSRQKLEF